MKITTTLVAFLSFSLLFIRCNRNTDLIQPQDHLTALKNWIHTNAGIYKNEELTLQKESNLITASLDWNQVKEYTKASYKYTEIPFLFTTASGQKQYTIVHPNKEHHLFYLVIREAKDGTKEVRLKNTVTNATLSTNILKKRGILELYYTVNGNWSNGWFYEKGNVNGKKIYLKGTGSNPAAACMYYSSTSYITVCWADGGAYNGTTCAGIPVTNYYTFCYMEQEHYLLPDEGGGWGGGYELQPPVEDNLPHVDSIRENLNNPCLQEAYNKISQTNFANKITNLLHSAFSASQKYNIIFQETNTLSDNKDGRTTPTIEAGRINIILELNLNTLPTASEEFIAATIYHEIIHAYLVTTGFLGQLNQHNEIANSYIASLSQALREAFPNLSINEANALAWGGLEITNAWNSLSPQEQENITQLNNYHHAGTPGFGTRCN